MSPELVNIFAVIYIILLSVIRIRRGLFLDQLACFTQTCPLKLMKYLLKSLLICLN